ncbi:nitronate monooxygenase [Desulfothermus naphthae]
MQNRICEILGVEYPIILGPMRLITLGEMAALVSESGGFGQIAASGLSGERLREEIKKAQELTSRPVGINIPIYRPNAVEALEIAIEMGIKTITTSAGKPEKLMPRIREAGLKVLHKVSSLDMALKAEAAGVDGVIAMGFEAGGHIGREGLSTLCLIPQLVDVLKIPVVAAGGIGDARGMVAAFALGAEGVEMGTRFIGTHECPVPDFFKELVLKAKDDSTMLLGKGAMPMRVLKNKAAMMISSSDKQKEDKKLTEAGDKAYVQSGGDADSALMPCGQVAGLVKELKSVKDIIFEMIEDAKSILNNLSNYFKNGERR